MRKRLVSQITQTVAFILLALMQQLIVLQNKIKKIFERQDAHLIFVLLLILIVVAFILVPSAGGGTGGTGG